MWSIATRNTIPVLNSEQMNGPTLPLLLLRGKSINLLNELGPVASADERNLDSA